MYFFTNRGNQFGRGAVRETRASPRKDAGKGPPDDVDLAAQKAHASFATGMGRGSLDSAHRAIVEDLSTDLEDSASKVCPVAGALEGFTSAGRCSRCLDQKVVINVSGARYITHLSVLNRYPESLLGDPHQRARYYDPARQEYFFDRHRPSFEAVFYFYQSGGRLQRPMHVPEDIFADEIEFYQLPDDVLQRYRKSEGYIEEHVETLPTNKCQRGFWQLFEGIQNAEDPNSSFAAQVLAIWSVFVILISIIIFCMETIPEFRDAQEEQEKAICKKNITGGDASSAYFSNTFFIIESACVIWFTIELVVRLLSCPSKMKFIKDIMNAFDFLAILPYYITLFTVWTQGRSCDPGAGRNESIAILRVMRVLRVLRIFKLSKHSKGLQVLGMTVKESIHELGMFAFFLAVVVLIFSSSIYVVEMEEEENQFSSIPDAFWWALVTMCTVGYGDVVPVGVWGKLIGTLCTIAGVLTIALPVPIIVANFEKFYMHQLQEAKGISEPTMKDKLAAFMKCRKEEEEEDERKPAH